MEIIIAFLLVTVTIAAPLFASVTSARTGQHRSGLTVSDIQARLDAEHARTYAIAGRW